MIKIGDKVRINAKDDNTPTKWDTGKEGVVIEIDWRDDLNCDEYLVELDPGLGTEKLGYYAKGFKLEHLELAE